jgi:hypothetical protein
VLEDGYDPANQAISELFDLAASTAPRLMISSGLLVSSLGLIAFGWLRFQVEDRQAGAA